MSFEAVAVPDELRLTPHGEGMKAMLEVVLPLFNSGSAAMSLGLCRASVAATLAHLKGSRFEHLNQSLAEALPTLRQHVASMQIAADGLAARLEDAVRSIEAPGPATMLKVLEVKAAAADTAIEVTSTAMRACGGAAFAKGVPVERHFRDAHASAVMAPTGDALREFIARALLGMPLF
jgi:alkylation response protein AidB-like acyl-CoA dehydrogenase